MLDLAASPAYDIARRLHGRGESSQGWFVLLKPAEREEDFLQDLAGELRVWLGAELRVIDMATGGVEHLTRQLQEPPGDVVLVRGLDGWGATDWEDLDLNRSALQRPGAVILWVSGPAMESLFRHAPNLRSWIGGSQFDAAPDPGLMTEGERRERLAQLCAHFGLADSQVIGLAQKGSLPADPEFAEWLVLLGRGDLVR